MAVRVTFFLYIFAWFVFQVETVSSSQAAAELNFSFTVADRNIYWRAELVAPL